MEWVISVAAKTGGQARTLPDRPELTCGEDVLTYGELHRGSNRLARGLRAMGVREGDLVSVALPNGVDFVAVCHAIWKLGATPQPLSFRLPAAELAAIVAPGKPRVVVGHPPAAAGVPVTSVDKLAGAGTDGSAPTYAAAALAKAHTTGRSHA